MMDDTLEKILKTARRLFEKQGYTATSMRQIAEETGIGKATIYHHFPDKTALFLALLEHSGEGLRFDPAAFRQEPDPVRRLHKIAEAILGFITGMSDLMNIARREVPEARAKLMKEYNAVFQALGAVLADTIQNGIAAGVFRSVDPRAAAQILFAMIQGTYASSSLAGNKMPPPEETANAILDIFFHGINAQ